MNHGFDNPTPPTDDTYESPSAGGRKPRRIFFTVLAVLALIAGIYTWHQARLKAEAQAREARYREYNELITEGHSYLSEFDYAQARDNYQHAVTVAPEALDAYLALINLQMAQNHPEGAAADFGTASEPYAGIHAAHDNLQAIKTLMEGIREPLLHNATYSDLEARAARGILKWYILDMDRDGTPERLQFHLEGAHLRIAIYHAGDTEPAATYILTDPLFDMGRYENDIIAIYQQPQQDEVAYILIRTGTFREATSVCLTYDGQNLVENKVGDDFIDKLFDMTYEVATITGSADGYNLINNRTLDQPDEDQLYRPYFASLYSIQEYLYNDELALREGLQAILQTTVPEPSCPQPEKDTPVSVPPSPETTLDSESSEAETSAPAEASTDAGIPAPQPTTESAETPTDAGIPAPQPTTESAEAPTDAGTPAPQPTTESTEAPTDAGIPAPQPTTEAPADANTPPLHEPMIQVTAAPFTYVAYDMNGDGTDELLVYHEDQIQYIWIYDMYSVRMIYNIYDNPGEVTLRERGIQIDDQVYRMTRRGYFLPARAGDIVDITGILKSITQAEAGNVLEDEHLQVFLTSHIDETAEATPTGESSQTSEPGENTETTENPQEPQPPTASN